MSTINKEKTSAVDRTVQGRLLMRGKQDMITEHAVSYTLETLEGDANDVGEYVNECKIRTNCPQCNVPVEFPEDPEECYYLLSSAKQTKLTQGQVIVKSYLVSGHMVGDNYYMKGPAYLYVEHDALEKCYLSCATSGMAFVEGGNYFSEWEYQPILDYISSNNKLSSM